MSKLPYKIQIVQDELNKLSTLKNFDQARKVVLSVVSLLDDQTDVNELNSFKLFNDDNGKIRANATWFYEDPIMADRKATYTINGNNQLNIDFKLYGLVKLGKQRVSWVTGVTSNFEDEPFNTKQKIGIDFAIPKTFDRVIVVLTNNYVIRTLELKGDLTATFQEIFGKWLEIKDFSNKTAVHTALWESFDLQPLNKKFYAGISERFITLRQHLIKENILDEKYASMFANRLIGRVIFTWFLDKKGIINPDLKYFDSHSFESDSEYYKTKLERLFFGVLNTPIDEREYKDELTPFLNGGLFEARQNDLYKDNKLSFPKNYFDDLFDFLSGYNFTTDESTSQFQQVAIDPEMLGRIFENLLAEITEETGEQARKAKGAFYTPREIVDYMCKESLKEYLKTKLSEDEHRDQRLYQLIDAPDKDFQDQDHNWRRDWKPYKDAIITALDDLKVLDPACGSGAFPIGMLQLLVHVYERLEPRFDGYKAKLQIIEKNIYGVDIEPMAVEIARLRTWLSIIVDEESDSKKIKPLPNLEFKFVCANSLIDLDQSGQSVLYGEDSELENKLRDIRDAYFNTESVNKKKKLKSDYEKLVNIGEGLFGASSEKTKQLKTYRPFDNESSASFFNPDFMFGVKAFGVIIANPPYIEFKKLKNKDLYKNYISAKGKYDIYVLFIEFAGHILEEKGSLAFINPTTFLKKDFGSAIRKYIKDNFTISNIYDFSDIQIFESAINYTGIFIFQKQILDNYDFEYHKYRRSIPGAKMEEFIKSLPETNSGKYKEVIKINSKELNSQAWNFQNDDYNTFLSKVSGDCLPLDNYVDEIFQGIASGKDEVFYITEDVIKKYDLEREILKPLLKGKDIKAFQLKWSGNYVIYPYTNDSFIIPEEILKSNFPNVYNYFLLNREVLSKRDYFNKSSKKWYELWNQRKSANFSKLRIVVPEISGNNNFALTDKFYGNTKTYHIILKENNIENYKYFIGILNSSLLNYIYKHSTTPQAGGFYAYKTQFLKHIPIKINPETKVGIIEKVSELELENDTDIRKKILNEIDDLVMNAYELTENQKETVRNGIK